jgi:hypothetical protein
MEHEWPEPPEERFTAQAEGKHPAPCGRHCEANAFEVEIRRLKLANDRQRDAIATLAKYFTSGNHIPVDQATIKATDFWSITGLTVPNGSNKGPAL